MAILNSFLQNQFQNAPFCPISASGKNFILEILSILKFHRFLSLSDFIAQFHAIFFQESEKIGMDFEKLYNFYANHFRHLNNFIVCAPFLSVIEYQHNYLISKRIG